MSGIKVELKGMEEVLKQLDVKNLGQDIQLEFNAFGLDVEQDAKQLAPVDEGFLKNQIYWKSITNAELIAVEIGCHADYAAYLEFGTRKFAAAYVASLPPLWQAFAAEFKGGKGGSFAEMLIRITAWVKRKGFASQVTKSGGKSKSKSSSAGEDQAAYLIARSILINGIRAHPFLYPAFEKNRPLLIERLKKLVNA